MAMNKNLQSSRERNPIFDLIRKKNIVITDNSKDFKIPSLEEPIEEDDMLSSLDMGEEQENSPLATNHITVLKNYPVRLDSYKN